MRPSLSAEEADASERAGLTLLAASAVSGTTPPAGPEWRRGALPPLRHRAMVFERPLCVALDGFTLHVATRAGGLDESGRFDMVLVAETAQVAGHMKLKTSVGQVVADETSYVDKLRYLLITARVKGGNSGGPVVNRRGEVAGIVVQLAIDSESGKVDHLGFASALPATAVADLLGDPANVVEVPFRVTDDGAAITTRS